METSESQINVLTYRSNFWRAYILVVLLTILAAITVGVYTDSIWIGILTYFGINFVSALMLLYKFTSNRTKL